MIYNEGNEVDIPSVDLLTFLFESRHCAAREGTPLHAEASDPAIVFTKKQARIISQQIGFWLRHQYGIGADGPSRDFVAVCSNGQAALPLLFYGVVAADGVYSAAATYLSADELANQVLDGPCKLLICSNDMLDVALVAAERAALPESNILVLKTDPVPTLEAIDCSAKWSYDGHREQLPWHVITDLQKLRNTTVCLVYTSGTTSRPKGVRISHANMVSEAFLPASINRPIWETWAAEGRPFDCRTLAHLGCAHISGVQGYFVNPFFDGGIVFWMPKFDMMAFLKYNVTLKITTFFSLPRVYAAAAFHPAVTNQLSHLRIAYSGAWPLDPRVYETTKLGGEGEYRTVLSQTWGATETTGATTHMPPSKRDKTGSVGGILPNMVMRLVDEQGHDVKPGQPGEAWLKGPVISHGYHNNQVADKAAFQDGWYRTGDLVEIRNDLVYVLGRTRDMIRYRGEYVPPAELESILAQYPGVVDAGVTGVPAEADSGEVPRALIVLRDGIQASQTLADEISDYVNDKMPDHKQLRGGLTFVDSIPRHVSGKLLRDQLQALVCN